MPQDGATAINKSTGERAVFKNGVWVKSANAGPEASLRGRLAMGMGPMVQAEQTMSSMEKEVNPLQRDWGASVLDAVPFLNPLAKMAGGQDYQDYTQASKAFESQLMPIMSGAAVSPSEAARQIKGGLPEFADTPSTLASKAQTRKMMLNGAAALKGVPLPYPDVPTYGVNTDKVPQGKAQKNAALKAKSASNKPQILSVRPDK